MESQGSSPPTITVQVKFAGRTIPVEVPAAATTAELKRLLQPLTNDGPITKNSSISSATSVRRTSNVKENWTEKPEPVVNKSRSDIWKRTGIVALHDCDLKVSYSDLFASLL
ncbi:hypothetical protein PR202_gb08184 [Eleusine coracana subsp. coracana]|uniref:Uncharacterized protein n=1 Tax=Eleusine coracana subsp. coracana TaxID=191504 RepID=A0AAV5EDZ5_ELECO|nr:hypothetical protein PR202_gb08184 [Eleusine coracana subsp. coracana]